MSSSFRYLLVAILLSNVASAAPIQSREERHKVEAWRKSMARVPLPKKGCFKVSYPATEWLEVACTRAPNRFYPPGSPQSVGSGIDFEAEVAGLMSSATGSFDSVNVTSENDNGNPDTYSLQLNSSFFTSPACAGASNPANCKGWQQFVYSSALGSAFIEYWLIAYAAPCPAGWTTAGVSCWKNSPNAIPAGSWPITDLQQLSLTGSATAGGTDTIMMSFPGNTLSAMSQDDVLSLANGWNKAEFGIFGDGGGSDATFNAGATMAVRTSVTDGTSNAPTCLLESFTSETNNLN
ncbi:MAG: hypothetical protein ACRD3J_30765, partial [Thermoanaerobaculia bacterium]